MPCNTEERIIDYGKAGLNPDQDDHQEEIVLKWRRDSHLRIAAEILHGSFQDADLGLALGTVFIEEFLDDAGADERNSKRQEEKALGNVAPPYLVGDHCDDQAEKVQAARAPASYSRLLKIELQNSRSPKVQL